MTETNRQRAEQDLEIAQDSGFEHAGVQAQLATAHALLAVADELAALRESVVAALAARSPEPRPPSCWAPTDAHGTCVAHGEHPHDEAKCLDCPVCMGMITESSASAADRYAADIAHIEETGFPANALRAARDAEGRGARG